MKSFGVTISLADFCIVLFISQDFTKRNKRFFFRFYHYYNRLDYQPFHAPVFLPRGGYKPDSETLQTPGRPRFLECPPLAVKPPFNFSRITSHGLKGVLSANAYF